VLVKRQRWLFFIWLPCRIDFVAISVGYCIILRIILELRIANRTEMATKSIRHGSQMKNSQRWRLTNTPWEY
jgi:hypothetical protein